MIARATFRRGEDAMEFTCCDLMRKSLDLLHGRLVAEIDLSKKPVAREFQCDFCNARAVLNIVPVLRIVVGAEMLPQGYEPNVVCIEHLDIDEGPVN